MKFIRVQIRVYQCPSVVNFPQKIEVVTTYDLPAKSAKMPPAERINVPFFDIFEDVGDEVTSL
jgi:hypothetical protein